MPYDADFLGSVSVPLPTLLPGTAQHAWNNGAVVDHTNYSLVFNQARELAVYTAANIDGEHLVPGISRRRFTFDPDVETAAHMRCLSRCHPDLRAMLVSRGSSRRL